MPLRAPSQNAWQLTGLLRSDEALWTERTANNPYAKARQSVDARLSYSDDSIRLLLAGHVALDLAYPFARDWYDRGTIEAYEWLFQGRETLVGVTLGPCDLTIGRQIVAWGEGVVLSPLDVVNPRDNREPGMAVLDDLRIPVLASRLGLFLGYHRLELMVVHESYFGLRPAPLSPFSPIRESLVGERAQLSGQAAIYATRTVRYRDEPDRLDAVAQQFYGRWSYKGPLGDFALYAASLLERTGLLQLQGPPALAGAPIELTLQHPRYTMFGQSAALPWGDFVLKWEVGLALNRPVGVLLAGKRGPRLGTERHGFFEGMAGVTYSGVRDTNLTLEVTKGWLIAFDDLLERPTDAELASPIDRAVLALLWSSTFLSERGKLQLLAMGYGFDLQGGWLARAEVAYMVAEQLWLGLGYITYQPGSEPSLVADYDTHDRVFVSLHWYVSTD